MTYQKQDTINTDIFELLFERGIDGLPEVFTVLFNQAMEIERSRYLQAEPYERSVDRRSYANGYKLINIKTRIGSLNLKIPQTRDSGFYPNSLEKGIRSERAIKLALAEMYVQGVSTRKVTEVIETMCGFNVTSTEVSNASKLLDEELEKWRTRSLGKFKYIYFDAMYEKIRYGGCVRDCAVLIA